MQGDEGDGVEREQGREEGGRNRWREGGGEGGLAWKTAARRVSSFLEKSSFSFFPA